MMPSRQPRVPSIGFDSRHSSDACSSLRSRSVISPLRLLDDQLLVVGQELVQRRVEQPDRHRQPVHRLEDARRSRSPAARAAASSASRSSSSGCRRGSCAARSGSRSPRNMCSVRQRPMPSAPNSRARLRVLGKVGVRAHLASAGAASAQPRMVPKWPVGSGVITATSPRRSHRSCRDRDDVAFAHGRAARASNCLAGEVDLHRLGAADRGLAHAARDDRRVRHETAARREDALRRDHAVQVVGRRLGAHEDHVLPRLVARLGLVGGEVHLADRGARRRVQALGEHVELRLRGRTAGAAAGRAARAARAARPRARSIRPSSTISTAMRSAAAAVRLPTRVCSMNRRPCSIVNSMSHMSW